MGKPRVFLGVVIAVTAFVLSAACGSEGTCPGGKDMDGNGDCNTDAAKSPIGGACTSAADCVSGATTCNDDPGGQCTKACKTDADCSGFANAICEPGGGNCYQKCSSDKDCTRDGYACVGGTPGYQFCDPVHGVGESCSVASDCAAPLDICNDDPGGQCTHDCTKQADCDGIPGAVCESDRPGHCYAECKTKADCPRDGYDCVGGPNPEGKMWCDVVGP